MTYTVYLSNGPYEDSADPIILIGLTAEEAVTVSRLAMVHGYNEVDAVLRLEFPPEDEE